MLLPHGHNLGSSYGEHLENTGGNLWFLFCHEQKGERPSCARAQRLRRGRIFVDGRGGSELESASQLAATERPGESERRDLARARRTPQCAAGTWTLVMSRELLRLRLSHE
ncbi:unnamed protein product [Rangifer tarandus platyrhynchus]|uniref:Uncharacterized protein n=1 Tax=Rangifer tarandus platyrhynchus TaxID=3082113 RepID=A0ABN8YRJ1_RANTA|nr:unnamed protein product [Rangifer tarandus platyrhynchus]